MLTVKWRPAWSGRGRALNYECIGEESLANIAIVESNILPLVTVY